MRDIRDGPPAAVGCGWQRGSRTRMSCPVRRTIPLVVIVLPALVLLAVTGYCTSAVTLFAADQPPSVAAMLQLGKAPSGPAIHVRLKPAAPLAQEQWSSIESLVLLCRQPWSDPIHVRWPLWAEGNRLFPALLASTLLSRAPPRHSR
ncbi:MAG: hypothetical protein HKP61_19325 [Dactylosporangium sp.]|nr:hypothetical protein [Dactylosporangium sp.]NNJ63041.1 hypothetical protein [Dactylosporangium sp.]